MTTLGAALPAAAVAVVAFWGSLMTTVCALGEFAEVPEPSSDTISEPSFATAAPTGRPQTLPSGVTNPVRKSS